MYIFNFKKQTNKQTNKNKNTKKQKKLKKKWDYLRKMRKWIEKKIAAARVKIFLVTRISRNKSIFFGLRSKIWRRILKLKNKLMLGMCNGL